MSFRLQRGAKGQPSTPSGAAQWREEDLIWGVPRRPGHDDQDDPKAHAGLTQHAFEAGNDERAICGFEPAKRAMGPSSKPKPQLAVPTPRLNPRCPKCTRLIANARSRAAEVVRTGVGSAEARADEQPVRQAPASVEPPIMPPTSPPMPAGPPDRPVTSGQSGGLLPRIAATDPRPFQSRQGPPAAPPPPAETWGGTVYFAAGQSVATIRPPRQRGIGVVASVVSGPAGTRVASVTIDAQGEALIALSEPARAPVNVAWFAVPGVADQSPEVPPGMT